jgi:hypothetical protein
MRIGEKAGGKEQLGRPRHRWLDNIRMRWAGVERTGLVWLRIGTGGELM